ncbi:hypothetical protein [Reichenbachiella ulvae]|uniref:Outer membrane protein beta-barrel domain-containing protein n=1 Tax=Reichenbachiella ulvae TaxID=2980104 RepID=A0ABT3CZS9_9BACT|nr:hypothetical protein [Reichenbachiella ulvae]MCV9389200.1 hypothetical protein [Reichenbachiella ulvae]
MKKLSLCLSFVLVSLLSFAQSEHGYTIEGEGKKRNSKNVDTDWTENFFLGGGISGLYFNQNETVFGFAVNGGYRWSERFITGVSMGYYYHGFKNPDFHYNIYSPQLFAQYRIYGPINAMALYEYNFLKSSIGDKFSYDGLFLGGSYNQSIGSNGVVSIFVLYNVLYDEFDQESGYSSPLYYGMNFMFGF